jgi:hypothetical protein
MTDRQYETDPFDSAALAASSLAAVLSVTGQEGPYVITNLITGITLIVILLAFEIKRTRSFLKSIAMGMVIGLISWLIFGFILETILPPSKLDLSSVSNHWLGYVWFAVTVSFALFDQVSIQKKI